MFYKATGASKNLLPETYDTLLLALVDQYRQLASEN